jgi:prepilin peptidase CpaA
MAAIGLWIGADNLAAMLWVALAGGVIALTFISARSAAAALFLGEAWALRLHRRHRHSYGLALAAGALLVYPQTVWFVSLVR